MASSPNDFGPRFEVLGELGRGGAATVYLARDEKRGENVALKVLHQHLANEPDARERLEREVKATSRLDHEHILEVHEVLEIDGRILLTMPVHPGSCLEELVAEEGPLPAVSLEGLALDLAAALGSAHRRGVIHRDVSPRNVMVHDGKAVLADFGLARLEGQHSATATTLGTWGYSAPEILEGVRGDPRSDVFSFGAVLYFAATGHGPFDAPSPAAMVRKQIAGEYLPLSQVRPDLPKDLVATIEAMLDPEPDARPQGARAVADALTTGELASVTRTAPAVVRALPPGELPAGGFTLLVRERPDPRRKALRRKSGAIQDDEDAVSERALALAVAQEAGMDAPVGPPPAAMRNGEFKLVESVDENTVQRLYNSALRAGFDPVVVEKPFIDKSEKAAERLGPALVASIATLVATLIGSGAWVAGDGPLIIPLVALALFLPAAYWLAGVFRDIDLKLAFTRVLQVGETPVEAAESTDALTSVYRHTLRRLDELEEVARAPDTPIPQQLMDELERTVTALRERAARLYQPVSGLPHTDEVGTAAAAARIARRLDRLETLESGGVTADPAERKRLRRALEAHEAELKSSEKAETTRTLVSAHLLEIGAAAWRARHQLEADVPTQRLLDRLQEESSAASKVLEEIGDCAGNGDGERRRRLQERERAQAQSQTHER